MSLIQLEKWQLALLKDLREYLDTCYWNKNQKEMISPFDNTGESFITENLEIKAYNWAEDDEEDDYNLRFGDIKIYWYKYLGRGTSINKNLDNHEFIDFYNSVRAEIQRHFGKYAPDKVK